MHAAEAMKHHVSTVFESHIAANRAMDALLDAGFPREKISLLMSKDTRVRFYPETADNTGWGMGVGAILGSLVALATTPPVGMFVAGPLAAALGGAAFGAASGGLVGALVDFGLPAETARVYEEHLGGGGIFVGVDTESKELAERARRILESKGSAAARERLVMAEAA